MAIMKKLIKIFNDVFLSSQSKAPKIEEDSEKNHSSLEEVKEGKYDDDNGSILLFDSSSFSSEENEEHDDEPIEAPWWTK